MRGAVSLVAATFSVFSRGSKHIWMCFKVVVDPPVECFNLVPVHIGEKHNQEGKLVLSILNNAPENNVKGRNSRWTICQDRSQSIPRLIRQD